MAEEGFSASGFAFDMIMRPELNVETLVVLGVVVFVSTLLMSFYPMGRIERIPVADVLR